MEKWWSVFRCVVIFLSALLAIVLVDVLASVLVSWIVGTFDFGVHERYVNNGLRGLITTVFGIQIFRKAATIARIHIK